MRAVIQRVTEASVTIDGNKVADINSGFLVFLGVMNTSLKDSNGSAIVVSQFTLYAQTKKGNRPSYIKAAKPEIAKPIYKQFVRQFEKDLGQTIQTGTFGADMKVALLNDGPVTIIIDSKARE